MASLSKIDGTGIDLATVPLAPLNASSGSFSGAVSAPSATVTNINSTKIVTGTAAGWGDPIASAGANAGGIDSNNGMLLSRYTLPSGLSPNKTIYPESPYVAGSPVPNGLVSYTYGLPNGGPSGLTVQLCFLSFSYGWAQDWCVIELFQTYYLNTGYRRYTYYSGYQPIFAETTGAFGRSDVSITNTWIGQYANGTTSTPSTATDASYWKGRVDVVIPSYWGGHVRVTTNHTPVATMNSSYQLQFT